MFIDRIDAAEQLAERLLAYENCDGIVLAVPRGGVPIGAVIAARLKLPLDLALSKKIGHPRSKEYAIGAVGLEDAYLVPHDEVSQEYIRSEMEQVRGRLREMNRKFRHSAPLPDLKGKTVILVDDGIATGATLMATVHMMRKAEPGKMVIAVPVASEGAEALLRPLVDDFISLLLPAHFGGVGAFYERFDQVSDEEVLAYLANKNGVKGEV